MNGPNRSKYETISDILSAIATEELTISKIQYKTYITYQHLKKYLTYLVQEELIIYKSQEKRFKITQRGLYALALYTKMDRLLVRNMSHKNMEPTQCFSSFPWTKVTNSKCSSPVSINQFDRLKYTVPIRC